MTAKTGQLRDGIGYRELRDVLWNYLAIDSYERLVLTQGWPLEDLTPDSVINIVIEISRYTGLFNAAGVPCTAQPAPAAGTRIPASLQLVGPPHAEELLLSTALRVEAASHAAR